MKLIKCKTRKALGDITNDLPDIVEEILAQFIALKKVASVAVEESEFLERHPGFDDEFTDYRFDIFEEYLDLPAPTSTQYMSKILACATPALDRRLADFLKNKTALDKLLQELCMRYIPLSEAELADVKDKLKETFGNLLYFLYYQFEMDVTVEDLLAESDDARVESNVYQYVNSNGMSVKELVLEVKELLSKYSPRMAIFDKYPELEEEFTEIVGPYAKDLEVLSDLITEAEVITILKGGPNFDIESYIKKLESSIKSVEGVKSLDAF